MGNESAKTVEIPVDKAPKYSENTKGDTRRKSKHKEIAIIQTPPAHIVNNKTYEFKDEQTFEKPELNIKNTEAYSILVKSQITDSEHIFN